MIDFGQLLSFVLQFSPLVEKELVLWLRGLCHHLLFLFYFFGGADPERRLLLEKLKSVAGIFSAFALLLQCT